MKITRDYYWGMAEGSCDFGRLLGLSSTFREKLKWIEEAETLSLRFSMTRTRRYYGGTDITGRENKEDDSSQVERPFPIL